MSVEADESPWDDEEEIEVELSPSANIVRASRWYKYGAKLECGDVVWGFTSAPEIFDATHHRGTCEEHGSQAMIDFVSTKPLGRP